MFGYETKKANKIRLYREFFNTDNGKIVLHDLCKACHIYNSTYDDNPQQMAYREGERSVVLRILKTINIDPYELDKLLKGQSGERE